MQNSRIPKVIHLMWFGGNPYPPLVSKCINSWYDIVPDYKIKVWTDDMIKDLDYKYLQDALKVKKYAFACDVVRAYALYTEGGIYMDTDVFLKRRFDEYLVHDLICFIETYETWNDKEVDEIYYENGMPNQEERLKLMQIDNGQLSEQTHYKYKHTRVSGIDISFLASVKGHPFLKKMLDIYKVKSFLHTDGSLDMDKYLIGPHLYASCAASFGFKVKDEDQLLPNDMMIYHGDLYNRMGKSAFAKHCYNHSWAKSKKSNVINRCKEYVRIILAKLHLYSMYYRYLKYDK